MCTKKAEILNKNNEFIILRCGYQTALFNGYLCRNGVIFDSTHSHLKGLHVLDVQ